MGTGEHGGFGHTLGSTYGYNGATEEAYADRGIEIPDHLKIYEYFLGFEGDDESGLWTVFARVSVNRDSEAVTFLDYKTPEGKRMENPLKPTSFA